MSLTFQQKKSYAEDQKANLFSRLFLRWSNEYAKQCHESQLTEKDIRQVEQSESFIETYNRWHSFWLASEKIDSQHQSKGQRLKWTMRKTFQKQIIASAIMSFVAHQASALIPLLIYIISLYITRDRFQIIDGAILLLAIFCPKFMRAYLSMHSSYILKKVGSRIFSCLCYSLTQKSLKKMKGSKGATTASEKAKLVQFDCSKVIEFVQIYTEAIFELYCLVFTMACLFFIASWQGLLSCVILFTLSMVRYIMFSIFQTCKANINNEASQRIKKSTQVISNIKFIKVNVLEDLFFSKLNECRSKEVSLLRRFLNLGIFATVMQHASSRISIIVFILLYTLNENPIDSALVFSVLLFFHNMLLHKLMNKANSLDDINISLDKIQRHLTNEERDCSFIERQISSEAGKDSISVQGKGFYWQKDVCKDKISQVGFSLTDLNFNVQKGEFIAIIGEFGSGKSSILNAILGEMISNQSKVSTSGRIAYANQNPWIFNDTVKNNILFGETFEEGRYKKALHFSRLETDLELFTCGDQTIIGENGSTISGGQKARISLARALYLQADIYVLDDILSALDAHVSAFIFQETLAKHLKGKTIILATHLTNYLGLVNRVFMVQNGCISKIIQKADKIDLPPQLCNEGRKEAFSIRNQSLEASQIEADSLHQLISTQQHKPDKQISQIELFKLFIRRKGGVKYVIATLIFMLLIIKTNLMLISELNNWISSKDRNDAHYYQIYIIILVACELSIGAHAFFEFNSQFFNELHRKMIRNLLAAPMNYFQTTSISDSMNKLSYDIKKVDNQTITQFRNTVFYISLGTSFIVNSIITYLNKNEFAMIILVFALIVIIAYYYFYFMVAIRQIHKLQQSAQIPIYSCYVEILTGAPIIRAYGKESFVKQKQTNLIEKFLISHKVLAGVESYFTFVISAFTTIITTALFFKIFVFRDGSKIDFFLIYNIFSFERTVENLHEILFDFLNNLKYLGYCEELMNIPQQQGYDFVEVNGSPQFKPRLQLQEWVTDGRVEFKDFSVKYRPELETVLSNLTLSIKAGEKIGVVGRTGSGKSTTILSLLRILQTHEGDIQIDGTSLYSLDIQSVRAGFSVILQEHFLFSGTVRDNIDPLHVTKDQDIEKVLDACGIWESLKTREGLDTVVEEGGQNFSAGEKQLINISRTLLNPRKIVLVDEATASIDFGTDALLQRVIKDRLRDSTMITIAHRIDTILSSNRVLVLDQGQIAEFNTPQRLLSRPNSIFNKLYKEFKNDKDK